jgi:hypothetical protein
MAIRLTAWLVLALIVCSSGLLERWAVPPPVIVALVTWNVTGLADILLDGRTEYE